MAVTYAQFKEGVLVPYTQVTAEDWANLKPGEVVEVRVRQKRNSKFNALWQALIGYTVNALKEGGQDLSRDDVHKEIKRRLNYTKLVELSPEDAAATGSTHALEYVSTKFDSMSEQAFKEYVTAGIGIIEEEICPYLMESPWADKVNSIITEFRK